MIISHQMKSNYLLYGQITLFPHPFNLWLWGTIHTQELEVMNWQQKEGKLHSNPVAYKMMLPPK